LTKTSKTFPKKKSASFTATTKTRRKEKVFLCKNVHIGKYQTTKQEETLLISLLKVTQFTQQKEKKNL
jgi:hypothetical protein